MIPPLLKHWTVLLLCLIVWNGIPTAQTATAQTATAPTATAPTTTVQTTVSSAPTMLWQKRTLNVGNGLLSNTVYALGEDTQGCLWVGTIKGLSRFDGHTFSHWYAADQMLQGIDSSRCTLPHTTVTEIVCDSVGQMWFGTELGVAMFNQQEGVWRQFLVGKEYNRQQRYVLQLQCDVRGTVWMTTSQGIFCFYKGAKNVVQPFPEMAKVGIGYMSMDKFGNIWIATETNGLFVIQSLTNPKGEQQYSLRQYGNFQGQRLYAHSASIQDGVIISTSIHGSSFDYWYCTIKNPEPQPYTNSILTDFIGELLFLTEQKQGACWVQVQSSYENKCHQGLYYVQASESLIGKQAVLNGYTGRWFRSNRTGYVYVGMSEGVCILAPTDMYKIPTPAGQTITALALDDQKQVWLGTERGVFRAPATLLSRTSPASIWASMPLVLNAPPEKSNASNTNASGNGRTSTKNSLGNAASSVQARTPLSDIWKPLPLVMSSPRTSPAPLRVTNIPSVRIITPSLDGDVLIGTERGIWKYDGRTQKTIPFEAFNRLFPEAYIKDIAVNRTQTERRGDLWVAAAAPYGMMRLSATGDAQSQYSVTRYSVAPVQESGRESEGVSHSIFIKLFYDHDGALWLGTLDGLNRWMPERNTWQQFFHDPNDTLTLAAPRVRPLIEDEAGNMIICSYGAGLSVMNTQSLSIRQLTARQGLRNTNIFSVLPFRRADSGKEYWICIFENATMAVYEPRTGRMTEIAMPHETGLLTSDGVTTNADATVQPHKSNILRLPDGTYLADYRGGLVHIDPNRIVLDTALPRIVLSAWMRNDTLVSTLPRSGDTIRLPYNSSVSFDVAVLEMMRPEACTSAVMLEGIDGAWKNGTGAQSVRYTTLPNGTFTLRLRAGKDGLMSDKEYTITLIVKQPVWKAWWFLLGIVLTGASSVAGVTWTVAQWQNRQETIRMQARHEIDQLQHLAAEYRLKTLQMQMDPHFIHGTMTVLQNLILEGETDRASDYVGTFTKHVRSLLFNNNRTNITLAEEINLVRGYIQLEETRFASPLLWEIVGIEDDPTWLQNGVPPFIMQPFVENAIRHGLRPLLTKPHEYDHLPQLTIRVERLPSGNAICCTIEDNGVGRIIATQNKQRLTERGINENLSISTVSVAERLRLLEAMYGLPVSVEYEDLWQQSTENDVVAEYNGHRKEHSITPTSSTIAGARTCGTRVKITIPFVMRLEGT